MSDVELTLSKKKLNDLRVIDLKYELEKRNLDKSGVKTALIERLAKAVKEEGENPDDYLFAIAIAAPSPSMSNRPSRKGRDTSGITDDDDEDKKTAKKEEEKNLEGDSDCVVICSPSLTRSSRKSMENCETVNDDEKDKSMASEEEANKEINKDENSDDKKEKPQLSTQDTKKNVCVAKVSEDGSNNTELESAELKSPGIVLKPLHVSDKSETADPVQVMDDATLKSAEDKPQKGGESNETDKKTTGKPVGKSPIKDKPRGKTPVKKASGSTTPQKNKRKIPLGLTVKAASGPKSEKDKKIETKPSPTDSKSIKRKRQPDNQVSKGEIKAAEPVAKKVPGEVQKEVEILSKGDDSKTDGTEEKEKNEEIEKAEKDADKSAKDKSEGSEKGTSSDKKEDAKKRRERSHERPRRLYRPHRSRSRDRYIRTQSTFRTRGFGRSFGPRRDFPSTRVFMRERFPPRDVERHREPRRYEDIRTLEIARQNREESAKIEREREILRMEKERLERLRSDVLRKEREQQREEREKIERERAELRRRAQMSELEDRRGLKRPFEAHGKNDWSDRKRPAGPRETIPETSNRFGEFQPRDRGAAFNERRAERFESRPKTDAPKYSTSTRDDLRPGTERTFSRSSRRHDSPDRKPREKAFDRGQRGDFANDRGHAIETPHPWENVQNGSRQSRSASIATGGSSQWVSIQKSNWIPVSFPPPHRGPPPQERWATMDPRVQPQMAMNRQPPMGPSSQIRMYGGPANELMGAHIPGSFSGNRFNAIRPF